MGRKNRKRPLGCPVEGCDKRGLRADLLRHASAVHPDIGRESYAYAIDRNATLARTRRRYGGTVQPVQIRIVPTWFARAATYASIGGTAALVVGIVILALHT